MTLEQIKNRQEQINELLYTLWQEMSTVVERVVGEQPKTDGVSQGKPTSGLLEELLNSQDMTHGYIEELYNLKRLLTNGVFTPTQPECAAVKSAY